MMRPKWLSNARGFSIAEGLVAAAIVSTTAVGTAGLATYLSKQSQRAQLLNRVVVLQGAVQGAVLDSAQYRKSTDGGAAIAGRDGQIDQMLAQGKPTGFALIKASGDTLAIDPAENVLAIVGQRVGYTVDGSRCNPTDADCPLYLDLDFDCSSLSQVAGCNAAYRVGFKPQPNQVTPAPLGAPLRNADGGGATSAAVVFAPADYSLLISYDAFQQAPVSRLPSATDNVMITGMNRTTGQITWVDRSVAPCADGEVANSITTVSGRLEFRCHKLSTVMCPDNYVLQQFNFAQLDPPGSNGNVAGGLRGTCVYRWRTDVPWQSDNQDIPHTPTDSTVYVSAPVCNADVYDVAPSGSCRAVVTQSNTVQCPYACDCYADPNGQNYACHDTCYRTASSSASTSGGIDNVNNVASCTLTISNDCGSTMTAYPAWGGTCKVKERNNNPGLTYPPTPNGSFP